MSESTAGRIRRGRWRPREEQRAALRRRYVWRGFFTAVGLLLLALLLWALLPPFWHPNSKLVIVQPPRYPVGSSAPLVFSQQQQESLQRLAPALYHTADGEAPLVLDSLASVTDVTALGDQLRELHTGGSDILMMYVAAHGIGVEDEAYLVCENVNAARPVAGLVRLDELLRQMARSPARLKLLILDSGQLSFEPRWGVLANRFPQLLPEVVARVGREYAEENPRSGDPNLWVLNSNAPLEKSHYSPALQQTVFGFFVSEGLRGPADLDGDLTIDLGELHRFVSTQVDHWVRHYSAGNQTQTPQLLTTSGSPGTRANFPVLLSVTAFPKPQRSLNMGRSLATAREASYTFSYVTGAQTPSSEYTLMARATDPLITSRAGTVLLRSYYAAQRTSASRAAAEEPDGEGPPEEASPGDEAAGEEQAEGEQAKPKKSPWVPIIGELLAEGWTLRDRLVAEMHLGSIADVSPHQLRAFETQWNDLELAFRSGRPADERVFAAALQRRLAPLRQLTGTLAPEQLPPEPEELAAWTGASLQLPAAHSLGLLEALSQRQRAASDPAALDEDTQKLIDGLQVFLDGGSREEFEKWVAERTAKERRFREIQLAGQLAEADWLSWPTIQQTLRTCRMAERVTSAHPRLIAWCQAELEQAERLRLRAERVLTESSVGADERYARTLLERAEAAYEQAEGDMRLVDEALRAEIRLSRQVPYLARWRAFVGADEGGNAPSQSTLLSLVNSLQSLDELLNTPGDLPSRLTTLRGLYVQLRRQEERVTAGLEPDGVEPLLQAPPAVGSSWRIEGILRNPLAEAPLRSALLAAGEPLDVRLAEQYRPPAIPSTPPGAPVDSPERWSWLSEQNRLQAAVCQLAGQNLSTADIQREAVQQAWLQFEAAHEAYQRQPLEAERQTRLWETTGELGKAMETFYARLPAQIRETTRANQDLRDPAQRPERVAALRSAQRALRWVAPQDAPRLESPLPSRVLQRVDYYDELAWQLRRLRIAEAFARASQLGALEDAARPYRNPPETLADQPSLRVDARPPVEVTVPEAVSLVSQERSEFVVRFRNTSGTDLSCWLVLQYPSDVVQVSDPLGRAVLYHEPVESDGRGFANPRPRPTLILPSGDSQSIRLQVSRGAATPRPAQLVIKTIARGRPAASAEAATDSLETAAQTDRSIRSMLAETSEPPARADTLAGRLRPDESYQREVVDLRLPLPPGVVARVIGAPGTWSQTAAGLTLHPFPNRHSDYRLRLVNQSGREKTVDVQMLALRERPAVELPDEDLDYEQADQWLTRLGATDVLANVPDVTLPADGTPVPVPFNRPAADGEGQPQDASKQAEAGKQQAAAETPGGGESKEETDEAAPRSGPVVNQGLLLLLTDKQSRRRSFVSLPFAPQRPRRFLRAEAAYDMNSQQLRVHIAARDPAQMPPDAVQIRGEFAERLPSNISARLEGELRGPEWETTLYANIPARPRRRVELRVHVDDYPRAFVFRVLCGLPADRIAPESQLMQARVLEPAEDEAFAAPLDSLPVKVAVDAPTGTFQNGSDFVEIGFDEDSDREFRDDQPLRFYSDRQSDIRLVSLQPDGLLRVAAWVGDFDVRLPGRGLQNVRVNVLARLVARKAEAWSMPVPVTLDSAPPTIARIKTDSGNRAVLGKPLKISVWAEPNDLSGMAGAEAAFDTDRTGEFPEAGPVVPGKPASGGSWEITLPTDQLAAGAQDVLVRVKDRVGNVSDPRSYPIVAVTAEEAEQPKETLVRVTGRVLYREQPVADATVTLKGADGKEFGPVRTDEQGAYRIDNVPVGVYDVQARGVVNNTPRFPAEALSLEIKQGDPRIRRLDIAIRPNRQPESE